MVLLASDYIRRPSAFNMDHAEFSSHHQYSPAPATVSSSTSSSNKQRQQSLQVMVVSPRRFTFKSDPELYYYHQERRKSSSYHGLAWPHQPHSPVATSSTPGSGSGSSGLMMPAESSDEYDQQYHYGLYHRRPSANSMLSPRLLQREQPFQSPTMMQLSAAAASPPPPSYLHCSDSKPYFYHSADFHLKPASSSYRSSQMSRRDKYVSMQPRTGDDKLLQLLMSRQCCCTMC